MSRIALDDFMITMNVEDREIAEGYYGEFLDDEFEDERQYIFEVENFDDYIERLEEATSKMYGIYNECLIAPETLISNNGVVEGIGFGTVALFDSNVLEQKRDDILNAINDFYYDSDYILGTDVMKCGSVGYDWDGNLVANVDPEIEVFVQLGTATGELSIFQTVSELDDGDCLYVVKGDAADKDIHRTTSKK